MDLRNPRAFLNSSSLIRWWWWWWWCQRWSIIKKNKNEEPKHQKMPERKKKTQEKTHIKKSLKNAYSHKKIPTPPEKNASRCRLLFRRRRPAPPHRRCERLLGRTEEVKETRVMPTHANADFYFRGEEITNFSSSARTRIAPRHLKMGAMESRLNA